MPMRTRFCHGKRASLRLDDAGFTILLVLGCLAVVAASLTAYAKAVQNQAAYASYAYRNARHFMLASFLGDSIMATVKSKTDRTWWAEDRWSCHVADTGLWLSVRNHAGLVDLNTAGSNALAAGLETLGVDSVKAGPVADDLIRFREAKQSGATTSADLDPDFRSGPFRHPSDAYVVRDLADVSYWDISDVFTVYGRSATTIVPLASDELRARLATQEAQSAGSYVMSPYATVRVAFLRDGRIIDSWIFDYEYSASNYRRVATIAGQVFERSLATGKADCSALLAPEVLKTAEEVLR